MSEEHVYLLWDCDQCGKKAIPCSPHQRYCPSCDHPRTFAEFDHAYLPGDNDSWDDHDHHVISRADQHRLNNAGASWFCVVCYADNYGDERHCHHCETERGATDKDLRDDTSYASFVAYMEGDQGASADLVENFGEYAGMRAAHGESFDMNDDHEGQLERANEGRSAFQSEMEAEHASRPSWDDADLPSTVESYERTHGSYGSAKKPERTEVRGSVVAGGDITGNVRNTYSDRSWRYRPMPDWVKYIPLAFLVIVPIAILIWGFQTHQEDGVVSEMNWERVIQNQQWMDTSSGDWQWQISERPEIKPVNGSGERAGIKITSCRQKHHHYQQYQCGTKQVSCTHMESYTVDYSCTKYRSESYSCNKTRSESYSCGTYQCNCTTRRNSNGSASRSCSTCTKTCSRTVSYSSTCSRRVPYQDTCYQTKQRPIHSSDTVPKYCQRSIEKTWCDYKTQKWVNTRQYKESGNKRPAYWPKGPVGPLERTQKRATYEIVFKYDKDGKTKTVSKTVPYSKFQQFKRGDAVTFVVNNFGMVQSMQAGDLQEQF